MKSGQRNTLTNKSLKFFRTNVSGWILLLPSLFLFYYLVWKPIGMGITYSFFDLNGFKPTEFVGFRNYRRVISDTQFLQTLKNTVFYVVWSLIIGFPLPIICAIMMHEMMSCKQYFKIALYLPAVIPAVANSLLWTNIYAADETGLLNMILYQFGINAQPWLNSPKMVIPLIIIASTWQGFGSTILYYLATLQSVNTELYEATRLDGAGFFQRIRHVILPHMSPVILLMLIRQMIGIFQILDGPMVMTDGGPNGASTTLGLAAYKYAFRFNRADEALAINVITFVCLIWLTFVYFKVEKKFSE